MIKIIELSKTEVGDFKTWGQVGTIKHKAPSGYIGGGLVDYAKSQIEMGKLIACFQCLARPGIEWQGDMWVCELHKS